MIHYLSHTEIDREKWDDCISHSAFETLYPYSWYLDRVSPGWYALVMNDYQMVMPLTWKRKYGIRMLIQPLLAQQLGVFSASEPGPAEIKEFMQAISPKYLLVDICLNSSNQFESSSFRQEARRNYELDISDAGMDAEKAYAENTVRNIRKGLEFEDMVKEISMEAYLDLKFSLKENKRFKRSYFEKIYEVLVERGCAGIFGLFTDGVLHTAAFIGYSRSRCVYLNGCSTPAGKERRGMFVLLDHLIRFHRGKKHIFDFEGSNIPGVARFFEGFGADRKVYLRITRNPFQIFGITS